MTRGNVSLVAAAAVVLGFYSAPPAVAAPASPSSLIVDCGLANGVSATTITGQSGDTFTIDNTSGTGKCRFGSYAGVVSATNLDVNDDLAAGSTSTLTILSAGTFVVTPQAGGGTATTLTVVLGNPVAVPEYTITALSGEWYGLPTDGSGAFQCHRPDYQLLGWSHGSTIAQPGSAARVPDLKLASSSPDGSGLTHAAAADHTTLFAVWAPLGVEIVYDANVAAADTCVNDAGENLDVDQRSVTRVVYPQVESVSFADSPPCLPVDGLGQRLTFRGWSLTADGAVGARAPGAALPWRWEKKHGRQVQLFAQFFCKLVTTQDPDDMGAQQDPSLFQECANYTWDKLDYSGVPFKELSKVSLISENVCTKPPTSKDTNNYGEGPLCTGSWVASGGVTDAELSGVNLSNKNLVDIWITKSDLSNSDLSGADLAGAGLIDVNFENANFTNANMTDTVLTGSNFSRAQLAGTALTGVISGGITGTPASLPDDWALVAGYLVGPGAFLIDSQFPSGSDLSGVDLAGADLYGSVMQGVNLSGADLSGSDLDSVKLNGANLSGAILSGVDLMNGTELTNVNLAGVQLPRHDLKGVTLPGADLSGANLSEADLSGANLSGADLSGANLSEADLSGANLSGADLTGANLSGANLYLTNLNEVILVQVNFSGANLTDVDLSGRYLTNNLSGADLAGANLSGADLTGANLSGAHFPGANLSGANLSGLDLASANFESANLVNSNFANADLQGATLIDAQTTGADFTGANLTDVQSRMPIVPEPPPFINF